MADPQWDDSGWFKEGKDYSPEDPSTWSPEQRVNTLSTAGFEWVSGNGAFSLWRAPNGETMSEGAALTAISRGTVPLPKADPATKFTGAGLPFPYIQDGAGNIYRQTANGPVRAIDQEIAAVVAASAPRATQGFAPQHGSYTEETTGDRIFTTNGVITNRIPGASWASLSPQQQFQQEVAIRQMSDDAAMAREQASNAAAMERTRLTESGVNSRFGVTSQEQAVMDRARLGEDARQANIQSATNAFGDVVRVAPQLGQLALDNAGFTRDVLKTAPDYVARAFFQQGQTSPLPQVSQADIINQLRSNIAGFNTTLQGFNPQVGSYQAPAAYQPTAPGFTAPPGVAAPAPVSAPAAAATAPTAVNPYAAINAIAAQQAASGTNYAGFNAGADAAPGVNGFAAGGFTRDPRMIVGDSVSGQPTGHEEMVMNPTGAPIAVQPMNQQGQQAQSMQVAQDMKKHQQARDGIAKIIGFVENTPLQHALIDEMAKHTQPRETPRYATGTGLMHGQAGDGLRQGQFWNANANEWQWPNATLSQPYTGGGGTGIMGFQVPQLPTPAPANQADINALEKSVRPPAINQLLGGQTPGEMQFGFNLFTPNQLGSLSREGRDALGTTLATQFNETVPNVEDAIKRRWSTGNRNMAAAVGF